MNSSKVFSTKPTLAVEVCKSTDVPGAWAFFFKTKPGIVVKEAEDAINKYLPDNLKFHGNLQERIDKIPQQWKDEIQKRGYRLEDPENLQRIEIAVKAYEQAKNSVLGRYVNFDQILANLVQNLDK